MSHSRKCDCDCEEKIKVIEKNLAILGSLFVQCDARIRGDLIVDGDLFVKGAINGVTGGTAVCTITDANTTLDLNVVGAPACRRIIVATTTVCTGTTPGFFILVGNNTPTGLYTVENRNATCFGQVMNVSTGATMSIAPGATTSFNHTALGFGAPAFGAF